MTTIRLWAVLGAKSVGKSTTVGHLFGHFGSGANGIDPRRGDDFKKILLRGGGFLYVFARRQSRQEAGKSKQQTEMEVLDKIEKLRKTNPAIEPAFINVLLALRTDRYQSRPRAEVYLTYFVNQGWQIASLAVLKPSARDRRLYHRFGAPICYVNNPRQIGIAHTVGRVRNHFGWA